MKLFFILSSLIVLTSSHSCKSSLPAGVYKGKLEVKGKCMNYTISMQSKNFDTSMVLASWTDENTNKTYNNVFALASRCNFPSSINAGDEFYFKIDSNYIQHCMVCLIYYPTPSKKLFIKVIDPPKPK